MFLADELKKMMVALPSSLKFFALLDRHQRLRERGGLEVTAPFTVGNAARRGQTLRSVFTVALSF